MKRGHTLVELLVTVALMAALAAMLLAAVVRAQRWCKEWAHGAFAWQENRIEAFLNDKSSEGMLLMYATNKPVRWSFDIKPTQ